MKYLKRIGFGLVVLAVASVALATVPSTGSRVDYTGNGSTTVFSFTFRADAASWVEVYLGGVKQSAGYTVALNTDQAASPGGSVSFLAMPAPGAAVRIQRTIALTQDTSWPTHGPFRAKTLEGALDRLAMQDQQLARAIADLGDGVEGIQGPPGPTGSVATASSATISGSATIGGTLAVTGTASAASPTLATHLATKGYVDGKLAALVWTTFPTVASCAAGVGDAAPAYSVDALGVVRLRGECTWTASAPGAPSTIASAVIPVAARPAGSRYFAAVDVNSSTGTLYSVSVSSGGSITVSPPLNGARFALSSVSYVAGQ